MRRNILMVTILLMLGFVMSGCEVIYDPLDDLGYRSGHSDSGHHRHNGHDREHEHDD